MQQTIIRKLVCLTLALQFVSLYLWCQSSHIVAGPMLGYVTHREAAVWVQAKGCDSISIMYKPEGYDVYSYQGVSAVSNKPYDLITHTFILSELVQNQLYQCKLKVGTGKHAKVKEFNFRTERMWAPWSSEAPYDIKFLCGSCAYINDSAYDRPGIPYGKSTSIFNSMSYEKADFMIWLGDNTYLREADMTSASGIAYRYAHTRREPNLQQFLLSQPHYAMWDDHDFGDNDANKFFPLRDASLACFKLYWPATSYGFLGQGVFYKFNKSDADFFLTDGRTFRSESELDENIHDKTMLGPVQLEWLKHELKHSTATFKFICLGGQFLNTETTKESFNLFKKERADILKFINDEKINGVIFISGDRHHSELLRYDSLTNKGFDTPYTMYDLTSSPLTSGVSGILSTPEKDNPYRVPGALAVVNNYCLIEVAGPRYKRMVTIVCKNTAGTEVWRYTINESELKCK